ncbi:MAG: hypothetical protein KKE17_09150 [Proteobacteria bacterium]|nr:hypothetical protein [Pseudomonadota bacterium]MBU1710155.1 hypothetical protein [Pseudomonadota bacterium]
MNKKMNTDQTHQSWMNAITFAEAGEWDTARAMIPVVRGISRKIPHFFKVFMAVAFAEEGLHAEAVRLMEDEHHENQYIMDFIKTLGLEGIRMSYGALAWEPGE